MFVDGGCDKRVNGLVALIHLALSSVAIKFTLARRLDSICPQVSSP